MKSGIDCIQMNSIYTYDLIGKRFGNLVVERYEGSMPSYSTGSKKSVWDCKCDCGNHITVFRDKLKSGLVKSCGCLWHPKGKDNPNWTGYEEISGTYWYGLIKGAKDRGYEFDLAIEYCWNLYILQDRRCALSGLPIEFSKSVRKVYSGSNASLDRIDNNIGYVVGNVQWLHKDINQMKMDLDQEYFVELCYRVSRNSGSM